jgi:hypothetical protein
MLPVDTSAQRSPSASFPSHVEGSAPTLVASRSPSCEPRVAQSAAEHLAVARSGFALTQKLPPRAITFTDEQVRQVLADMANMGNMGVDPTWIKDGSVRAVTDPLSETNIDFGCTVLPDSDDARFSLGSRLAGPSRELLKGYVERHWGVDVTLCENNSAEVVQFVNDAIKDAETQAPGAEVRRALLVGGNASAPHASLVVYLQRGDQKALLFVDSTPLDEYRPLVEARNAFKDKNLAIYQVEGRIQRSADLCVAFAWEAMSVLCARRREHDALTTTWRIDDLIAYLKPCEYQDEPGVTKVVPPPELLRLAQKEQTILDRSTYETRNEPMRGSSKGKTLAQSVAAHRYEVGARFPMMDHLRVKGDRWRIRADIGAINECIGQVANARQSPGPWGDAQRNEFERRMLALAKDSRAPAFMEEEGSWKNPEALETLARQQPFEFVHAALIALGQIKRGLKVPPKERWHELTDDELALIIEDHAKADRLWQQVSRLSRLVVSTLNSYGLWRELKSWTVGDELQDEWQWRKFIDQMRIPRLRGRPVELAEAALIELRQIKEEIFPLRTGWKSLPADQITSIAENHAKAVRAEIARMAAGLPQMSRLKEVLPSASPDELAAWARQFEAALRKLTGFRELAEAGETPPVSFGEDEHAHERWLREALKMLQEEPITRATTRTTKAAKDFLEAAAALLYGVDDEDIPLGVNPPEDGGTDIELFRAEDSYRRYKATRFLCDPGLRTKVEENWREIAWSINQRRRTIAAMAPDKQLEIMNKFARYLELYGQ